MKNNFEQWIRESAPVVEIDEIKKEAHLAVLKERLRVREGQHRRRGRRQLRASMVAVVVVLMFFGGEFSELGSDGFDINFLGIPAHDHGQLVEIGMRGFKIGVPEDQPRDVTRDLVTQLQARIGDPVEMVSVQAQGGEQWLIVREYLVEGKITRYTAGSLDHEDVKIQALLPFIMEESSIMMNQVDSGELLPVGAKQMVVDGFLFEVKVYEYTSNKYGKVTLLKGLPIH